MPIAVGQHIPDLRMRSACAGERKEVSTRELCKGRKVVLFAVPGAFTSTCSEIHLPGFIEQAEAILSRGVDLLACTSVNDIGVLIAWGDQHKVGESITFLADGNGDFARAMDLELDARNFGLGMRSQRYAAIIEDGVIKSLQVDPTSQVVGSGADAVLAELDTPRT
jgi:peroxiredoxin